MYGQFSKDVEFSVSLRPHPVALLQKEIAILLNAAKTGHAESMAFIKLEILPSLNFTTSIHVYYVVLIAA